MSGKRFEAPRPGFNILARLGALAQMRTHEIDGFSLLTGEALLAERICSPVETFSDPADLCHEKSETTAGRPVSVRNSPAPIGRLGCGSSVGTQGSDEVREGQTKSDADSGEEEVWA